MSNYQNKLLTLDYFAFTTSNLIIYKNSTAVDHYCPWRVKEPISTQFHQGWINDLLYISVCIATDRHKEKREEKRERERLVVNLKY